MSFGKGFLACCWLKTVVKFPKAVLFCLTKTAKMGGNFSVRKLLVIVMSFLL